MSNNERPYRLDLNIWELGFLQGLLFHAVMREGPNPPLHVEALRDRLLEVSGIAAAEDFYRPVGQRSPEDGPWTCPDCGVTNNALRTRRCRSCGSAAPTGDLG
jgi:hypothetical protein